MKILGNGLWFEIFSFNFLFIATNIWPVHVLDQASFQIDASRAPIGRASTLPRL